MIFDWNVFKSTGFIFRYDFYYLFLLQFMESKYFFAIKILLNLFDKLVLNCSSRCFKGLFFLAGDVFFNFSFSQFRKILIQSMKYFLAVFDYSKILMDRSSRSEVYYKKSVLRNFAKFK